MPFGVRPLHRHTEQAAQAQGQGQAQQTGAGGATTPRSHAHPSYALSCSPAPKTTCAPLARCARPARTLTRPRLVVCTGDRAHRCAHGRFQGEDGPRQATTRRGCAGGARQRGACGGERGAPGGAERDGACARAEGARRPADATARSGVLRGHAHVHVHVHVHVCMCMCMCACACACTCMYVHVMKAVTRCDGGCDQM